MVSLLLETTAFSVYTYGVCAVVFLVCIKNPSMEAGNVANKFERERRDLAKGLKPRGNRDFQWVEDEMDFPQTYGELNP